MKNPLVSIIIPVYNGSNYLNEAIDSALSQSYKNIEIIVINDGSNDSGKTERIVKSYGNKISYISKKRGGVASALNLGIRKMKGEWFSWLSHDDVYDRDKVKVMIEYAKTHPKSKILYSDYQLMNQNGKHLHDVVVKPTVLQHMQLRLIENYPINGCALLINKTCFREVGNFNEKLITTQDYDLWFRFAYKYVYDYVPIFSMKSRLHPEQGSHTYAHISEVDNLYSDFINKLDIYLIINELKHDANKWMLHVSRTYHSRGYVLASKIALDKSNHIPYKNYLSYAYTYLYLKLPISIIRKYNKLKYMSEVHIYSITSKIKSIIGNLR